MFKFINLSSKSHLTHHASCVYNFSCLLHKELMKLHTQLDKTCIYHIIVVWGHSENNGNGNLLHCTFFETPGSRYINFPLSWNQNLIKNHIAWHLGPKIDLHLNLVFTQIWCQFVFHPWVKRCVFLQMSQTAASFPPGI